MATPLQARSLLLRRQPAAHAPDARSPRAAPQAGRGRYIDLAADSRRQPFPPLPASAAPGRRIHTPGNDAGSSIGSPCRPARPGSWRDGCALHDRGPRRYAGDARDPPDDRVRSGAPRHECQRQGTRPPRRSGRSSRHGRATPPPACWRTNNSPQPARPHIFATATWGPF
jgi:hypothetical protein